MPSLERHHLALVGFMGAGKSSVGKALASAIRCTFVDLDELIATEAGKTIPEIFQEYAEVGFRARERAALRQVLSRAEPAVIARYAFTMAKTSNLFYQKFRILDEEDETKKKLLFAVAETAREALTRSLGVLGIEIPERM